MTNLFISYYQASTPERQAEIDYCLKRNCENPLIDQIFCLVDDVTELPDLPIIRFPVTLGKPTFQKMFDISNAQTGSNDVNIIANADIVFDESLYQTYQLKDNDCWALSRWEMKEDYSNHPQQIQVYGDSQDVWIFRGKIKPLDKADFPLGKMGCDNRIAYEIKKAGYNITNPSKSVHTWHLHNSNVRGYNPAVRNENTVVSQPYLNVPVTSL